jgi:predicted lipoprotein with Yx(FWY)xxD motif
MSHPMHSRDITRILVALLAGAALIAGCGSDDEGSAERNDEAARGGETRPEATKMAGEDSETAGETASEAGASGEAGDAAREAGEAPGEAAAGRQAARAEAARGPRVTLRDSQFGPVLFDGRNRALYLFTRDPRRKTRCYGACAAAWPPFYAKGRPRAGRGVDRGLLGTIERRDGRRQVTYKGQALYFYVDDPRGQVLCNDIVEFGGTWYAVDSKGNPPA